MLSLRGSAALSPFRLDKILATLRSAAPRITHLYAEFWHFAWSDTELTSSQQDTLQKILTYGPRMAEETPMGELFLAIPRPRFRRGHHAPRILRIIVGWKVYRGWSAAWPIMLTQAMGAHSLKPKSRY